MGIVQSSDQFCFMKAHLLVTLLGILHLLFLNGTQYSFTGLRQRARPARAAKKAFLQPTWAEQQDSSNEAGKMFRQHAEADSEASLRERRAANAHNLFSMHDPGVIRTVEIRVSNVQIGRRCLLQVVGLSLSGPSVASARELSASIQGAPSDLLEITLAPGEKLQADPGTLVYMSNDIEFTISSRGGGVAGRVLGGGNVFVCEYVNKGNKAAKMALGTEVPSRIVQVQLDTSAGDCWGTSTVFCVRRKASTWILR